MGPGHGDDTMARLPDKSSDPPAPVLPPREGLIGVLRQGEEVTTQ